MHQSVLSCFLSNCAHKGVLTCMYRETVVRSEGAVSVAGSLMLFPLQFAAFARQLQLQLHCWCTEETWVNELGNSMFSCGSVCGKVEQFLNLLIGETFC